MFYTFKDQNGKFVPSVHFIFDTKKQAEQFRKHTTVTYVINGKYVNFSKCKTVKVEFKESK